MPLQVGRLLVTARHKYRFILPFAGANTYFSITLGPAIKYSNLLAYRSSLTPFVPLTSHSVAQNQQTPPTGNDVAGSAIFKKFLNTAEGYIRQPTRLKKLLTDAYQKASDKNEVGTLAHEAWETLQTMFRLIKASMSGEYTGVPGTTVAAAVAVLVYFISPIDLIPDFIPVLGLLDDVALVAWFSTTLKGEMDKFNEWEMTRPAEVKTGAEDVTTTHASGLTPKTETPAQPSHSNDPAAPTAYVAGESAKHAGTTNVASNTTDSSREPSTTATNTGGNVR
jgi:uncharacterized membrane protein YkvA (DUF1232 family)